MNWRKINRGIKKTLYLMKFLIPTLFFNFYYLPFKQAIHLPIWIRKPHFHKLGGKVEIQCSHLRMGMIRLGMFGGHMYPNNGIHWTHRGKIIFKGSCIIGNNSFIVTGKDSEVVFGDDFMATTSIKLISFIGVTFGVHARVGYECVIMDTNFHPIYDMEKKRFKKAYGPIHIGDNCWFGLQCVIMHSVTVPPYCIFGLRSVVTRGGQYESYCVHGGSPIRVLSRNMQRIIGQDKIYKYKREEA